MMGFACIFIVFWDRIGEMLHLQVFLILWTSESSVCLFICLCECVHMYIDFLEDVPGLHPASRRRCQVSSSISFLLSLWGSLSFRTQISSLLDWKPANRSNPACLYHLQRAYNKPEECLAYYTGVGIWTLVLMTMEQIGLARFMSFWHTN